MIAQQIVTIDDFQEDLGSILSPHVTADSNM